MMSTAERSEFTTVDEYLAAEELSDTKSEYIDGWVRAISGATVRHNVVKMNCGLTIGSLLKGKPCRPFDSDMKLRITHRNSKRFYYPDLQVICKSNAPTDIFQDEPILIIEVLSPSTRAYDLDEKLNAYLRISSLECYVILEQHIPFAIVMRRTKDGFLRETYEGIDTKIDFPFINCTLPMSDAYDGVEFTASGVQETEEAYDAARNE
ncbi:hypothetical protein Poly21_40340 [Allorhodopirellula heiligendammensis]|uniref:Putative restriction endonuclease domain-containing protein n=2 Tax=Allorhodopirellula heiligendammensis TaxID=2714739 RepID=A0A5C6BYR3_9BACT|nr:hypothetical protein Poly21_40340 [Allorhodopirellula heiligendammensis]